MTDVFVCKLCKRVVQVNPPNGSLDIVRLATVRESGFCYKYHKEKDKRCFEKLV